MYFIVASSLEHSVSVSLFHFHLWIPSVWFSKKLSSEECKVGRVGFLYTNYPQVYLLISLSCQHCLFLSALWPSVPPILHENHFCKTRWPNTFSYSWLINLSVFSSPEIVSFWQRLALEPMFVSQDNVHNDYQMAQLSSKFSSIRDIVEVLNGKCKIGFFPWSMLQLMFLSGLLIYKIG